MDASLKESVATLLAHIIKIDNRDIDKELPLFCKMMGKEFNCDKKEAKSLLQKVLESEYDIMDHIERIATALKDDKLSKLHLLEELNHMIYSDRISDEDYKLFEAIKKRLFPEL